MAASLELLPLLLAESAPLSVDAELELALTVLLVVLVAVVPVEFDAAAVFSIYARVSCMLTLPSSLVSAASKFSATLVRLAPAALLVLLTSLAICVN